MQNKDNKFLIVGLVDDFIDQLSADLAYDNNLYYLNVENLINYSILEKQKLIDTCGVEYFKKQEEKIISSLKDYENIIACIKYSTFVEYCDKLRGIFNIVYFEIDEKNIKENKRNKLATENLNRIAFAERDKFLKNNCDITLKCDINNMKQNLKAFKAIQF